MAGEIEAYLDARTEFDRVRQRMNEWAEVLGTVATGLKTKPPRISFSNLSVGLPLDALNSPSVDANQWKSAVEIQQLIASYYEARDNVRDTWAAVPQARKAGLQPPPEEVFPASRLRR